MNDELYQDLRDQIRQKPDWFDWSEPEMPDYDEPCDGEEYYDDNEGLYGEL
jgi:hypothetical protein